MSVEISYIRIIHQGKHQNGKKEHIMGTLEKERNAIRVVIGDRESNGYRLFINLLTDSLPALAIGMEPADERLLHILYSRCFSMI